MAAEPPLQIGQSVGARIAALLDGASAWAAPRRDRLRKFGLIGALAIFVIGLAWTIKATPELQLTLRIGPVLLLLLLSAPAGTVLNTIELYALSRLAGGAMSWRTSAEVTIYTSAANMLPLPGGVITKLAGLKSHGASYKNASFVLLLSFLVWGGLAFLLAGAAFALLGMLNLAALFGIAGAVILVVSGFGAARFRRSSPVYVVVGARIASLGLEVIRYTLAVGLVGASLSVLQASTFVVGSFVGALVVIAPHGLGVSEAATALLSASIGLSVGIGFMAAAITRLARLFGLTLIATVFIFGQKTKRPSEQTDKDHSGSI